MTVHIRDLAILLYNSAPHIAQMRGHPEYQNWGMDLIAASEAKSLAPLCEVLKATVNDSLQTIVPLNSFLEDQATRLHTYDYLRASDHAIELIAARKIHAGFILSFVSVLGWARRLGNQLYAQPFGVPLVGWDRIPYIYALAGMKIGALELAGQLVQHVYDVWMSAKEGFHAEPSFLSVLSDYRQLAGDITERQEWAIINLASELRESCYCEKPNFRAEIGAVLWTQGFIPESQLFMSDCTVQSTKLTKRFFQHIVRRSIRWIPRDPLIQYVWLEMKDRPIFNLRDHKSVFAIINSIYPQPPLSVFDDIPGPAGKIYAQTLIGFFKGDLSEEEAAGYMELCRYIEMIKINGNIDWLIALRMLGLRELIAQLFHWTEPNLNFNREMEIWYLLSDMARWGLDQANMHPGLPDCRSRSELPIFQVIEKEMVRACDAHNNDGIDKVLQTIEHLHMADLVYWLTIAPPLPSKEETEILQPLLEEQVRLLEYVRGAYFLMIFPLLPCHYRRYSTMLEDRTPEAATDQQKKFDPDIGRKEYLELRDQLDALFAKMRPLAPRYAGRCRSLEASIQVLVQAINSHAQS